MATIKNTATKSIPASYINNPFYIASEGLGVWFAKARNVALFLLIVSGLLMVHGGLSGNPSMPLPSEQVSAPAVTPGVVVPFEPALNVVFIILPLLILLAATLIFTAISGISAYAAAEASHGRSVGLKQAWRATRERFGNFFWLQVLTVVKVLLWSLLLIVPGIIMAVRYSLANIAFFDKKLSPRDALRESVMLTDRSWTTTFAAQVFFNLITLGIIEPLVTMSAKTVLYRQLTAYRGTDKPAPDTLSKVTLAISIVLFIGIGVVTALLFTAGFNYLLNTTV